MLSQNNIVVGSGISGLISALAIAKKNPNTTTYVIEKNHELGGLLRRFNYGEEYGSFDYGMHNLIETGEKELDDLIFSLFPSDEWQLLEGKYRDLAGIYFNNTLQYNTPYIDIRNLDDVQSEKSFADFFKNLDQGDAINNDSDSSLNAKTFLTKRFGEYVANQTYIPSLEKIHKLPAEELDYMATLFTPMNRIAMFDDPLINDIIKSDLLRDRLAYSDQRNLPLQMSTGRTAFYPKKYGMYRVINALEALLKKQNVQILTNTELKEVKVNNNRIKQAVLLNEGKEVFIDGIAKLVWSGGMPILARMLNVDLKGLPFNKAQKTIVVSMLIDKPLDMGDLYYFFCYQKGFNTYRLNNFTAYCKGATRHGNYPISLELLMNEKEISESEKTLEEIAVDELFRFKVTSENTKVVFAKAEILDKGFPMPSVNNISALNTIRERIQAMKLVNLEMVGILARPNLFFQADVIKDAYLKFK
tara:strand:- start:4702 stop:6120 length:1419 start_codon:yes stop_codon:yes gene_type:complete